MLSYLSVVQPLVDPGIYSRGVRLYLEGKVLNHKELTLDYWRIYQVHGTQTYSVKTPLLHLALSPHKYDFAGQALLELVSCSCAYFEEFGVCKHVVAVCASLEQEFNPTVTKRSKKEVESVLDQIFDAQVDKQVNEWLYCIEDFLSRYHKGSPAWIEDMVVRVKSDPQSYVNFTEVLKRKLSPVNLDWESEKRAVLIYESAIRYGSQIWWDLLRENLDLFHDENKLRIANTIWTYLILNPKTSHEEKILHFLRELSSPLKQQILDNLRQKFTQTSHLWVDFIFKAQFLEWIKLHYNELDPMNLIRACELLPEMREDFELAILNQVKLWSDFLQPGKYEEVGKVFRAWQVILGRSEYFEEAVKYFKSQHGKKKKLLKLLEA